MQETRRAVALLYGMQGIGRGRAAPPALSWSPPILPSGVTWTAALHLLLHVAVPVAVAVLWFRPRWRRASLVMLATMAVDVDHLLADPIYDPARCRVGFHPLHTAPAVAAYGVMVLGSPTRLIGIGLLVHMGLDALDCVVP